MLQLLNIYINIDYIFIWLLFATELLYHRKRQAEDILEGVKDWQVGEFWAKNLWRFYNI